MYWYCAQMHDAPNPSQQQKWCPKTQNTNSKRSRSSLKRCRMYGKVWGSSQRQSDCLPYSWSSISLLDDSGGEELFVFVGVARCIGGEDISHQPLPPRPNLKQERARWGQIAGERVDTAGMCADLAGATLENQLIWAQWSWCNFRNEGAGATTRKGARHRWGKYDTGDTRRKLTLLEYSWTRFGWNFGGARWGNLICMTTS